MMKIFSTRSDKDCLKGFRCKEGKCEARRRCKTDANCFNGEVYFMYILNPPKKDFTTYFLNTKIGGGQYHRKQEHHTS